MSRHFFHETTHAVKDSQYHRLIYCEWCGLVVWNFNNTDLSVAELQKSAGGECDGNPPPQTN